MPLLATTLSNLGRGRGFSGGVDEAVCRGEDVSAAHQGAAALRPLGPRLGDHHLPGVAVPLSLLPVHDVVIAS